MEPDQQPSTNALFPSTGSEEKGVKFGLKEQEKYQDANFQGSQDIFERAFARLGFSSGSKIDVYLQKCSPLCDSEAPALRFDRS